MTRTRGLTMSLPTPAISVRTLQRALYAKAKTEPDFRFYSLWDKVHRTDVLAEAYRRCRANRGSVGVDGQSFEEIETIGVEAWLASLQEELKSGRYCSKPLKRVWIPKASSGKRPLGIPCIRDRVAQMAVNLVILPIFEADFRPCQYGFRPKIDAKMAIRRIYYHATQHRRTDIVDADLKDYFNTIPHSPLIKSVARRISDGRLLSLLKHWLETPVIETVDGKTKVSNTSKQTHRGTPQGGVISPLLANIYFRRFVLAWEKLGYQARFNAQIVNYADDFVICCSKGKGELAMTAMQHLMSKLGLTVNTEKTHLAYVPQESFDFLGYTFCKQYARDGRAYLGTKPSKKALKSLRSKIHEETAINRTWDTAENRVRRLNQLIGGWTNYFNQGPVLGSYNFIEEYTGRRLRRWLTKKHKQRGKSGWRLYSDDYLHNELGLIRLPRNRAELSSAKA